MTHYSQEAMDEYFKQKREGLRAASHSASHSASLPVETTLSHQKACPLHAQGQCMFSIAE